MYIQWNTQNMNGKTMQSATTWMELLSEVSQKDKVKHCMLSLTCDVQRNMDKGAGSRF